MKLINKTKNNALVVENLIQANSIFTRTLGLMFRSNMDFNEGLLISNCPSIHTCFMRFKIDVAFLDRNFKVLCIYNEISPFRMTKYIRKSYFALEVNGGQLSKKIDLGDYLELVNV